jgi:hypothetical protein
MTGRRGRRRRKLLDDINERRGYSHLKEEALDRAMWRARFGRGLGLSSDRQLNEWLLSVYADFPHRRYARYARTASKMPDTAGRRSI